MKVHWTDAAEAQLDAIYAILRRIRPRTHCERLIE